SSAAVNCGYVRSSATAYGSWFWAEWMSAQRLLADVELAALKVRRKQRGSKGRSPNRFLSSSLDPVAQQRLARMRLGLE
ncbi:MAG: hypothetical protein HC899_38930, partial [Leptolyngbyaceae cyanobacterium SM1_4_3]|nr:hypothetical protein [Leptolyngbyaceae cyanobacterium SM1_4_3]